MRLLIPVYFFPLISFLTLTSAHFKLVDPQARGFNEETLGAFPCGGQMSSGRRTQIPLNNPELFLALEMGHDQSAVQVLLALGNDPETHFNITLIQTFRQVGLGSFCLPSVPITAAMLGASLRDGLNATLQVVTNGDPKGGLYNCADLTFSSTTPQLSRPSSCVNGTGVTAVALSGDAAKRNANASTPNGQAQDGQAQDGQAPPPKSGAGRVAALLGTVAWGIPGAVVIGGAALL